MKLLDNLADTWLQQETVLTIGAFDGIHLGHQALIKKVVESARANGRQSGVVTFSPHPANVVDPGHAVKYIMTPGEKAATFASLGLDLMLLVHFTPEVASEPADQFIAALAQHLRPAEIWIGEDFALGKDRAGDVRTLAELGRRWGFQLHAVPAVTCAGGVVSSSRIRQLLAAGEMEESARLLGRYYHLAGRVVHGEQRGRRLGFPTANVQVSPERALPRDGVYACFGLLGDQRLPAVANLGIRPTFDHHERLLEVYFLDMDIDLYGCEITVEFAKFLRPELKFESVAALIQQMDADVAQTRVFLRAMDRRQYEPAPTEWKL